MQANMIANMPTTRLSHLVAHHGTSTGKAREGTVQVSVCTKASATLSAVGDSFSARARKLMSIRSLALLHHQGTLLLRLLHLGLLKRGFFSLFRDDKQRVANATLPLAYDIA